MSQATFELYQDSSGKWRWRLRHVNAEIIADSGEGYERKRTAQNGIQSVKENASNASVKIEDPEDYDHRDKS